MNINDFIKFCILISTASFHSLAICIIYIYLVSINIIPETNCEAISFETIEKMIQILGSSFYPDIAYAKYHFEKISQYIIIIFLVKKVIFLQQDNIFFSQIYMLIYINQLYLFKKEYKK